MNAASLSISTLHFCTLYNVLGLLQYSIPLGVWKEKMEPKIFYKYTSSLHKLFLQTCVYSTSYIKPVDEFVGEDH